MRRRDPVVVVREPRGGAAQRLAPPDEVVHCLEPGVGELEIPVVSATVERRVDLFPADIGANPRVAHRSDQSRIALEVRQGPDLGQKFADVAIGRGPALEDSVGRPSRGMAG